ncbi:hypothetical protein GY14_26175 [Delftia tsuruhatensis]|uniref:Uncharacterized protein n=1 Tax=Delftia tsuruhatensis TaxID=180282 RepID=A0ABM6E073_9BURK|nr:hypothetical protein BI380_04835 [Delftia tsuruhatensis]KEH07622.1 hypothetical protein GY14_26175 [Delftia tsuruhatensis]
MGIVIYIADLMPIGSGQTLHLSGRKIPIQRYFTITLQTNEAPAQIILKTASQPRSGSMRLQSTSSPMNKMIQMP